MTTDLAERPTTLQPAVLDAHRSELTRYCRRLLGSPFEADDAVQETMLRAWRSLDRFEGRSTVRAWLYSIATNVCNDMLRARTRRPAPTGLGTPTEVPAGPSKRASSPDDRLPVSQVSAATAMLDPVDQAVRNEAVHHAFAAALHYLPPRQRAVLVLREVLRWPAADTAELLGASVASVNSALQRARSKLADGSATPQDDGTTRPEREPDGRERDSQLVDYYADALERADVNALISQLVADATGARSPSAGSLA